MNALIEINSLLKSCVPDPKLQIMLGLEFLLCHSTIPQKILSTLSWRKSLSYRNHSIDLLCKSMDWFLYDSDHRHERVNILKGRHNTYER